MNLKTTVTFSTMVIAAVVSLFALGPSVTNQQAFAWHGGGYGPHHYFHHFGYYGHYRYHGHYGHYGY